MKQFRILAAASLIFALTACSSNAPESASESGTEAAPSTPAEETKPAETKGFSPDDITISYAEVDYNGETVVTATVTNNSKERLVEPRIIYAPAEGHTEEEVFRAAFGEDEEFEEGASYSRLDIHTIIEPGETSKPVRIFTANAITWHYINTKPEAFAMLAPARLIVRVVENENSLTEKRFTFSSGDISSWEETTSSESYSASWNTWDNSGIEWLPEVTGKDYALTVSARDESIAAELSVYGCDEAFANSYAEAVSGSLPNRDYQDISEESVGIQPAVTYYYSNPEGTATVFMTYYKESGTISLSAMQAK